MTAGTTVLSEFHMHVIHPQNHILDIAVIPFACLLKSPGTDLSTLTRLKSPGSGKVHIENCPAIARSPDMNTANNFKPSKQCASEATKAKEFIVLDQRYPEIKANCLGPWTPLP